LCYSLHIFSLALLVWAYVIFLWLWADSLRFERKYQKILTYCSAALAVLLLIISVPLVAQLSIVGYESLNDLVFYQVLVWTQVVFFLVTSIGFLGYGLLVYHAFQRSDNDPSWWILLRKLNIVMFTTTVCCLLRFLMLIVLYLEVWLDHVLLPTNGSYVFIVWLVLSQWIPFYGLLGVMQYVTRKSEFNTASETPLLESSDDHHGSYLSARIDIDEDERKQNQEEEQSQTESSLDILLHPTSASSSTASNDTDSTSGSRRSQTQNAINRDPSLVGHTKGKGRGVVKLSSPLRSGHTSDDDEGRY